MQKTTLVLFFSLISIVVFSQDSLSTGKVEYIQETQLDNSRNSKDGLTTLYFNTHYSSFIYNDVPKENEYEEIGLTINIIYGDKDGFPIHIDNTKKMFSHKKSKNTILIDTLITPEWSIIPDTTKIIGGYNCFLAEGVSYGRNYLAWFTLSLPINAGPYKLRGLPGLIMEAASEDGKVKFIFKKLDTSKASAIVISASVAKNTYYGRDNYLKETKKKFEEWKKYINSQNDGTTVGSSKKSATKKDRTIEKWEE